MRILFLTALLLLAFGTTAIVQAQELSKEEKKEWKKKAKEYKRNPAALKSLAESVDRYKSEANEYAAQINEMEADKANRRSRLAQIERENTELQDKLAAALNELDQLRRSPPAQPQMDQPMRGLVFRVQLGAYEKLNLPATLDGEDDNMDLEMVDGLQKIIIGKYPDVESADALRDYMRKLGIPDAWVVAYQDGVRISVEDVVPGYGM
jgi:small-conductance mechanosensitive channel